MRSTIPSIHTAPMVFASVAEIAAGLTHPDYHIRIAAAHACENNPMVTRNVIVKWIDAEDWGKRYGAMYACLGRKDVPLSIVNQGIHDPDSDVRMVAYRVCAGRHDVPKEWITRGLNDPALSVRRTVSAIKTNKTIFTN